MSETRQAQDIEKLRSLLAELDAAEAEYDQYVADSPWPEDREAQQLQVAIEQRRDKATETLSGAYFARLALSLADQLQEQQEAEAYVEPSPVIWPDGQK